jgi:hypothetical protein
MVCYNYAVGGAVFGTDKNNQQDQEYLHKLIQR